MNTPCFIISERELFDNVEAFQTALKKYWMNSRLAYSIKTNSLPWILEYLRDYQIMGEAVSDEEYQLAKMCGYRDENMVFNGPIKSIGQVKEAIKKGAIVNIDSIREVEYICSNKISDISRIGIRVNVDPAVFCEEDIDYKEDGFRFGFSEENGSLLEVVKRLRICYGDCRFGLHLHCNSVTRSLNVYRAIASYAARIISKCHLTPSFIDIGGGFFGGVEGKPTASDYVSVIKEELERAVDVKETQLIIEPGSAIIGSVVELHTSVIDVKDTAKARIITTDGSRIHIDPLWKKKQYKYSICKKDGSSTSSVPVMEKKQIICGYTCMDHDRLMTILGGPELQVGDRLIYHRVGAYTMTFGGPFIRYFPDVYVRQGDEVKQVRGRISTEDYYKIHSV